MREARVGCVARPVEREERLLEVFEADPILERKIERFCHDLMLVWIDETVTNPLTCAHRVGL